MAAPAPQGPSEADQRYEKYVKASTEDYRVKYGEAHYQDHEAKVS
jgi:hypothetical protein